ncbi:MAG: Tad domain-containing protein [Gammaproteobacteria bacterium]
MKMSVTSLRNMQGGALVLTALSLLVIVAMAGLAIDTAHNIDNKARLQNSVDAAALAAAMYLLEQAQANIAAPTGITVDTTDANQAGRSAHQAHLNGYGSTWLTGASAIEFCWSDDLQDFSNCQETMSLAVGDDFNNNPFFVRARVLSTAIPNFIMQVMPGISATRSVAATAVAGTTGSEYLCNVSPFFVCDNSPTTNIDTNCDDGECWGNPVTTNPNFDYNALTTALHAVNASYEFDDVFFAIKGGSGDAPAVNENSATDNDWPEPDNACNPAPKHKRDGCAYVWDGDESVSTNMRVLKKDPASKWKFNDSVTYQGNRFLLNILDSDGSGQGAAATKDAIVYGSGCIDPTQMDTQPGNVSSIDAAINTLFGLPKPPFSTRPNIMDYADYVTYDNPPSGTTPHPEKPISFHRYHQRYNSDPLASTVNPDSSQYHQRLMNIPVVNCRNPDGSWAVVNGNKPINDPPHFEVLGTACFFLPRIMFGNSDKGKLGPNEDYIIAQHVHPDNCPPTTGIAGETINDLLTTQIILYEHYESTDS